MRLSCTVFEILSFAFQKLKRWCDSDHAPFRDCFVIHRLGFDTVYLYAKIDDSSFSSTRDITMAPKLEVGHVTLTTPF